MEKRCNFTCVAADATGGGGGGLAGGGQRGGGDRVVPLEEELFIINTVEPILPKPPPPPDSLQKSIFYIALVSSLERSLESLYNLKRFYEDIISIVGDTELKGKPLIYNGGRRIQKPWRGYDTSASIQTSQYLKSLMPYSNYLFKFHNLIKTIREFNLADKPIFTKNKKRINEVFRRTNCFCRYNL